MDELDRRLRGRLAALAEAVPMSDQPTRLSRLSDRATRWRMSGFSALASATSLVLVVGVAIALVGREVPPTAWSPVPATTASPDATEKGAATTSPSPEVTATPEPSAAATRPPADVALPYPHGCPAYGLSPRRCAYIIDWALAQAGATVDEAAVQLLGDPECAGKPAGCGVDRTRSLLGSQGGTMAFIVRVRVTPVGGHPVDFPVFCGVGGETSMLCTDTPVIGVTSPMSGYHDVPCGPVPAGEPGSRCATPLPTIAPAAADDAVPLRVPSVAITIDHAGAYSIDLGDAVLPNGILSVTTATLPDDRRSDVLIPRGIQLQVLGPDGKPLENAYQQGWRPGTERVHVRLVFTVESFDPGTTLTITDVVVR
jgi:hypothetical protein